MARLDQRRVPLDGTRVQATIVLLVSVLTSPSSTATVAPSLLFVESKLIVQTVNVFLASPLNNANTQE